MNKRGSVPLLVALGAVPVTFVMGIFAIDATRFWIAQARLQSALDAAALTAARDINSANRDKNVRAVLAANYNGGAPNHPDMVDPGAFDNVAINPIGTDQVAVEASVDVKPLMSNLSGLPNWTNPFTKVRTIKAAATAHRTNTGIELALVFDVTLSMVQSDGTNSGKNRVESARDAALTMLSVLYADNPDKPAQNKKWLENLFISVVPFNVTANYGSDNTHFLSAAPPATDYPDSWSGKTGWGGCVEMRPTSLLDANPQTSGAGLTRYYWPSTYKAAEKYDPDKRNTASAQPYCLVGAAYTDNAAKNVCMGHNDWTAPSTILTNKRNTLIAAFQNNSLVKAAGLNAWATAHGPNMMCPTQKVLPLTRDRTVVENNIKALANLPFSYGTNVASGLQAGWFTLSPKWRAENGFAGWPSAEPPAVSDDPRPTLPALPLDYHTPRMSKVMVVLTDGDNLWYGARELQGDGSTLVRPESRKVEAFYGSYGYLGPDYAGDTRLVVDVPTNPSNVASASDTALASAAKEIDEAVVDWCEKIRAKAAPDGPEQITIYTIGFGANIGQAATDSLTKCASKRDGKALYYPAPTATELKKIFTSIGNDLSTLRLSQ
jgi:Flp pilus assembly protein TadG